MVKNTIGVILMAYCSPATLNDIPTYLTKIYRGKEFDKSLVKEFQRR